MRLVVGITGASGVNLGVKFIESLPPHVEVHLIASDAAKVVTERELGGVFEMEDIGAKPASGSFLCEGMAVIPCSINTLAKISCGIADTLVTRAAAVMLKERRKLLLAPREMPFGTIELENMSKLSLRGAIIAPPVFGYYSGQQTLEEMERFIIGKWMDMLGIENSLYKRWEG